MWSTIVGVTNVGVGPNNIWCPGGCPPAQPQACPSAGMYVAGVAVGSAGNAFVAVPWTTPCPMTAVSIAGAQLYEFDPAGAVTALQDPGVETFPGQPPDLCALHAAGACEWVLQCGGAPNPLAASHTLPQGPPPGTQPVASAADAMGNTFIVGNGPISGGGVLSVASWDAMGAMAWSVGAPASFGSSFGTSQGGCQPNALQCPATIVADQQAGAIVPGYLTAAHDFGCGSVNGGFLIRFGPAGQCIWNKSAPSSTSLLSAGAGAVYVTGTFQGTFNYFGCPTLMSASGTASYLLELDGTGACVWAKSYPTATLTVTPFPNNDLLLSTPFTGTIDLGGGPLTSVGSVDLAVGRVSSAGAPVWSRRFGAAGATLAFKSASADALGGAVEQVHVSVGSVDFGGGPVTGNVLVKLEDPGMFGWQKPGFAGPFASDPCGAVITAIDCSTCAPGNLPGFTVQKLAP